MWVKYRCMWAWGYDKWKYTYTLRRDISDWKADLKDRIEDDHYHNDKFRRVEIKDVSDKEVPGEVVEGCLKNLKEEASRARKRIKSIKDVQLPTFEALLKKTSKKEKLIKCKPCKGKGKKDSNFVKGMECPYCRGKGKIRDYEVLV